MDSLQKLGIEIVKVFGPEHGFRGTADAGEHIKDGNDAKTGLPVVSLYGANRKPSPEQLRGIDVVIFDIQDVGVRYYTYPSTMHLVMEACAENNKKCIVAATRSTETSGSTGLRGWLVLRIENRTNKFETCCRWRPRTT